MQKNMMKNEVKYGELIGSNQKNSSIVTNMQRKERGITLIALMITIIVLLILAGVTLSLTLGERGIFKTAKDATLITKIKEIEEQAQLSYADKKMEELAGGEKVTIDKIVNELKEQGYKIIQKVSGANIVTGIELSNKEITMDKNATASLTYTLKYESGIIQYFAEIGGKYYEITMDGDKIKVNEEPSNIGEPSTPPMPTITLNKENIITAEIGENGTIKVVSSESYGEVEITITCAGKTATCKVTVVPPPPSAGIPEAPRDTAKEIPYNWDEIEELADLISSKADEITDDTEEVAVSINGKSDTLRVGDTAKVDGKVVRILGFNHDELSDTEKETAYGGGHTYAGISFEYLDFLMGNTYVNEGEAYIQGWGACHLRETLNTTIINNLTTIKSYIKEVKKAYCAIFNSAELSYCNDRLWLLSCAEIYNYIPTVTYDRLPLGLEGKQYKFYRKFDGTWNENDSRNPNVRQRKKPSTVTGTATTNNGTIWTLRSPYNYASMYTMGIYMDGHSDYVYQTSPGRGCVAPGFSI